MYPGHLIGGKQGWWVGSNHNVNQSVEKLLQCTRHMSIWSWKKKGKKERERESTSLRPKETSTGMVMAWTRMVSTIRIAWKRAVPPSISDIHPTDLTGGVGQTSVGFEVKSLGHGKQVSWLLDWHLKGDRYLSGTKWLGVLRSICFLYLGELLEPNKKKRQPEDTFRNLVDNKKKMQLWPILTLFWAFSPEAWIWIQLR